MVGRFNARPGDGDTKEWVVWDNATNGHRGTCGTEEEALELASELELRNTVHGPRDQSTVRRVQPPVPVDVWQRRIGELDAWVHERGVWLGRVRFPDGRISFIEQGAIKQSTSSAAAPAGQTEVP